MKDLSFDELEKTISEKKLVFVDFWGEACRPCEALVPILEKVSSDPKFSDFEFLSINVTSFPEAGAVYGIFSVPTLVIFIDGEEKDRKVGFVPQQELEQFLTKWKEV